MITINGDIYITNYNQSLDELIGDELDMPFSDIDWDETLCEDCDDCDDFEADAIEDLIDEYVELLTESCLCPDCIKSIIVDLLMDFSTLD